MNNFNLNHFICDGLPNTHLKFTEFGMKMIVTLNIPKEIVLFMPNKNVFLKNKFYVHWAEMYIKHPAEKNIVEGYNALMKIVMHNARSGKIKFLEHQKNKILKSKIL